MLSRLVPGLALALLAALLLFLGLTPFDFSPRNRVSWHAEGPGLRFHAQGIALREKPLYWDPSDEAGMALRIEAIPGDRPPAGLGVLLSLEDGVRPQPLLVAQWKKFLIVRVRDAEGRGRGYWELGAAKALLPGERVSITIRSSREHGTVVDVNGTPSARSNRSLLPTGSRFGGQLLLGSAGDGRSGWTGVMTGLAIYDGWLDDDEVALDGVLSRRAGFAALTPRSELVSHYDFSEGSGDRAGDLAPNRAGGALRIPAVFEPPAPNVFSLPVRSELGKRWFLRDVSINVVGFVPFGLLAVLLLLRASLSVRRAFLVATLLGGGLSLAIETVQIYIPARNSSLTDLGLNVLGTALGAIVGIAVSRWSEGVVGVTSDIDESGRGL